MSETVPTPSAAVDEYAIDTSLWTRFRNTPWRDLLLCRLWGRLDHQTIIAEAELPADIKRLVDDVVTRSKLWPRERQSVARELCDHFADGLLAGNSAEQLTADFGDLRRSATLIRRAKIRCRAWSWHLWHRGWQGLLCLSLLTLVVWSIQTLRFATARPTITFDLVVAHDKASRRVPEEQRAWPLYRRGLVQIDKQDLGGVHDQHGIDLPNSMVAGPSDPEWNKAREYLGSIAPTVDLFVAATGHEQLGFINRDPENEDWLTWSGVTEWESYNAENSGPSILLTQTQDLYLVHRLLAGALNMAIEDADGPRIVELTVALLHMADHFRQTFDVLITDFTAFATARIALQQIRSVVIEQDTLLSDADLDRLEPAVEQLLGGGSIGYRFEGAERVWADYLQRAYTDDGKGSGRMTPQGIDILREFDFEHPVMETIESVAPNAERKTRDEWAALFAGAAVVTFVADRRDMRRKMQELNVLLREAWTDPQTQFSQSRYYTEVRRIAENEPVRYLPVAASFWGNPWWANFAPGARLVAVNAERDAALIAIAFERYRRAHGEWPPSCESLIPEFLKQPPGDPYAPEKPLMYQLSDGGPQVWSVGPNGKDDDFMSPTDDLPGWKSDTGDWRLLPPEATLD